MRHHGLLAFVLVTILGASCGDNVAGPDTVGDYVRELGEMLCERAQQCDLATRQPCAEAFRDAVCESSLTRDCDAQVEVEGHAWAACAEAVETTPCETHARGHVPEACLSIASLFPG